MRKIYSRLEVYEMVWEKPIKELAPMFNLSNNGFSQICAKADIPIPSRGYWNKLRAGKEVFKPHLPQRGLGKLDFVDFGKKHPYGLIYSRYDVEDPIPTIPIFAETIEEVKKRIQEKINRLSYVKSLSRTHEKLTQVIEQDNIRLLEYEKARYSFNMPYLASPFDKRRLKIVNTIFFALSNLGYKIYQPDKDLSYLSVKIGDIRENFFVGEYGKKSTGELISNMNKPASTKATIGIGNGVSHNNSNHTWSDDNICKVEDHIPKLLAAIILNAELSARYQVRRIRQNLINSKYEVRETALLKIAAEEKYKIEQHKKLEQYKIELLIEHSNNMSRANQIRSLINNVGNSLELSADESFSFSEWSNWALDVANRIDPVKNGEIFKMPTVADIYNSTILYR
ncbi:MAG: hypothetical protein J0L55_12835 [Caulobacterales bacterium]|nr:hypothetical protein [Caulobacterales bacterium]